MKCLVVLCLLVPTDIATATEVASLDLFPNFNTFGVNVKLATPDAEKDAWTMLEYGLTANERKCDRVANFHKQIKKSLSEILGVLGPRSHPMHRIWPS